MTFAMTRLTVSGTEMGRVSSTSPVSFLGRKKPRAKLNPRGGRMPLIITSVAPKRRGANRSTNCLIKEKGTPSGPGLELEVPKIIFLKSLTVGLGGALWILLS